MTSWRACGEVAGSFWGSPRDPLFLSSLASALPHPKLPGSSRAHLTRPPSSFRRLLHTPLWACVPFLLCCAECVPNSASHLALNFECGVMAQPFCLNLLCKITDAGNDSFCQASRGEHTGVWGLRLSPGRQPPWPHWPPGVCGDDASGTWVTIYTMSESRIQTGLLGFIPS